MAHHCGYPALGSISCREAGLDGGGPVVNDHIVPNHPQLLRVRLLLALVLHCLVLILNAILLAWVQTFSKKINLFKKVFEIKVLQLDYILS